MAHKIEKTDHMVSGEGKTPWHKLGTVVEGLMTAEECIKLARLDWTVHKVPMYAEDFAKPGSYTPDPSDPDSAGIWTPGTIIEKPVPKAYGIQRDRDKRVLGVVGAGYTPLQNERAFGFLNALVSAKEAMFVTAGSLEDGACIWLLVKLPGDILVKGRKRAEDRIEKYLLLTNRHDGFGTAMIKFTPVRVVCWNTLSAALAGGALTIRHTASIGDRVDKAFETLGLASEFYVKLGEVANEMSRKAMKEEEVKKYLLRCLKRQPSEAELSDAAGVADQANEIKVPRAMDKLLDLYETGKGADMARGTLWGAYNAVTEYVDHHSNCRTPDATMKNTWLEGNGHALKVRAMGLATQLLKA